LFIAKLTVSYNIF